MKKIIVPVDFSEYSENALKTAVHIAKRENAEVLAVHMLEFSDTLISESANLTQERAVFYLKLAQKRFDEFLNKEYLKDIKVTPIVKHFKIFSDLKETAREEGADLIVMGSHGSNGLKEMFVGSNTEKVVRTSEVPVLVIKGLPITKDFKNAVFACDFSDNDIEPYLRAKSVMKDLGCNLHLLHVNTPYAKFSSTREKNEKVSNFLQKAEGSLYSINDVVYVSDYSVEEGILEYANKNEIDLIVMATHGRKGLSHFLEGSISEDVANHSILPVMTFKM